MVKNKHIPHIVLVIGRGDAIRNFLYTDTLRLLSKNAKVTLITSIMDEKILNRFDQYISEKIKLVFYQENKFLIRYRDFIHKLHFKWIWTEPVRLHHWPMYDLLAKSFKGKFYRIFEKALAKFLAYGPIITFLTSLENKLTWYLRPNNYYNEIFEKLNPDFVFNCSHIHSPLADMPMKIANKMGFKTGTFIFSWDNLFNRSRIFPKHDYYFMWNNNMKNQLLNIYPNLNQNQVIVTGTPQFDFHFIKKFELDYKKLCSLVGLDNNRPFILYTTGIDHTFPEEHHTLEFVINILNRMNTQLKPQLLVRTYVKGTSKAMIELSKKDYKDVVFPNILWDSHSCTPLYEDNFIYTNLIRHCSMGINVASTVSLELMMFNKPVINIGFNPPGSNLPKHSQYSNHLKYDHYKPVVESGGVMVAWHQNDLEKLIIKGLNGNDSISEQDQFIKTMFCSSLDGLSGSRIANALIKIINTK